jgi:TFIIF-interacting CTD phosphatase-like protein
MSTQKSDKLLILDLDETLFYATEREFSRPADFSGGPYRVYKRPHVDSFLEFCFARFEVAVWTSASPDYAHLMVKHLFTGAQPAFVWAADRCTQAFDADLGQHYSAKRLRKICRQGYNLESIIMVDDSPEKLRANYGNLIVVKPYYGAWEDDELLILQTYLNTLLDVPNVRRIEKRFWRTETRASLTKQQDSDSPMGSDSGV